MTEKGQGLPADPALPVTLVPRTIGENCVRDAKDNNPILFEPVTLLPQRVKHEM